MSFERKYLDPIDAVPTAKLMFATNELLKIQDKTQGVWRRMIFVPFERVYSEKEQNKNLANELLRHLSGIFNWAVKGIKLLQGHNGFVNPEKCQEALAEFQLRMNPARAYLQDAYEVNIQSEGILCSEAYIDYKTWCELKPAMAITLELGLKKYSNKKWQINRGELLEIDNQPIDWKDIESLP